MATITRPHTILEARAASKSFTTAQGQIAAVSRISLSVAIGEFLCIVGPSGCGKTTLLQMLGGLEIPTSGQMLLDGQPMAEPPPDISFVFQKPNLMPWRTVIENILLPLQVQHVPGNHALKQAHDTLTTVGLAEFADAYPKGTITGSVHTLSIQ